MKATVVIGFWFAVFTSCAAEQVVAKYDWSKLASGQPSGATVVSVDGNAAVKVVNTNDTPLQVQLLKLVKPVITKKLYAVVGEIKYEGVHGTGYLEMWNYFPPAKAGMLETAFFSRTLGESGEMGKISGTSNWRRFMLPFDRTGSSEAPARLEINIHLPAQGTVYLGPVQLVEYSGGFQWGQTGSAEAWWPDWAGGLIGGVGGAVLGCLGGLLTWLSSKGRAREFVLASTKALIGVGILCTAAGFVALGLRQPSGVWFVLLLVGVLLLVILPFRLRAYQHSYEALEMRRMAAMDA